MTTYTTTLNAIRAASPCKDGWGKLLSYLGKTKADDEPLELLTILDSNGLDDALWVLSHAMQPEHDRLSRHFQAWCVERVLSLFEAKHPGDHRVRDQIATLRNDEASPDERAAARDAAEAAYAEAEAAAEAAYAEAEAAAEAARDATRDAAWYAPRDAARAAAWDAATWAEAEAAARAARDATRATRAAARDAARAAARAAAWDAAWDAARAARAAARAAARDAQEQQLRKMLTEGF